MKYNIKYFFVIVLAIISLSLCGCGENDSKDIQSGTDISSADVSSADVSGSDASEDAVSASDWRDRLDDNGTVIANMIISSTDAFNAEDIDAYMSYIEPESIGYSSTKADVAELFDNYDLVASIDELTVDAYSDAKGTATVTVTQTTKMAPDGTGKGFAPVRNVLEHKLIRSEGRWYFESTAVVSRRELTNRWDTFIDFVANPNVDASYYADEDYE